MTQPTMGTKRPEILAPAGNADMLRAAVYAGADAVYLGLLQFNARRSAENFSAAALRDAVAFCHARDVKVYVAVNTLAYPDELPALCEAARPGPGRTPSSCRTWPRPPWQSAPRRGWRCTPPPR